MNARIAHTHTHALTQVALLLHDDQNAKHGVDDVEEDTWARAGANEQTHTMNNMSSTAICQA